MRVYRAYSNNVQTNDSSAKTYCRSAIIHGGLAIVILTYLNIIPFMTVFILIINDTRIKMIQQKRKEIEMEMIPTNRRL